MPKHYTFLFIFCISFYTSSVVFWHVIFWEWVCYRYVFKTVICSSVKMKKSHNIPLTSTLLLCCFFLFLKRVTWPHDNNHHGTAAHIYSHHHIAANRYDCMQRVHGDDFSHGTTSKHIRTGLPNSWPNPISCPTDTRFPGPDRAIYKLRDNLGWHGYYKRKSYTRYVWKMDGVWW